MVVGKLVVEQRIGKRGERKCQQKRCGIHPALPDGRHQRFDHISILLISFAIHALCC